MPDNLLNAYFEQQRQRGVGKKDKAIIYRYTIYISRTNRKNKARIHILAKRTRYFKANHQLMLINISQAREKGEKGGKEGLRVARKLPMKHSID